jgi:dTDP-4-dehydrorhamnose 3,5-epimerase
MNFVPTALPDVVLVEPRVFPDHRGFFFELFNAGRFKAAGLDLAFVQDNFSRSKKGVVRGLHFQEPQAQGKLVRTLRGRIWDVAVDIRVGSPTFGRWVGETLDDENRKALWIPPGFAHGFCALSDEADVEYKCTALYAPECEQTLLWNDPELGIPWPATAPILAPKDEAGTPLARLAPLPAFRKSA